MAESRRRTHWGSDAVRRFLDRMFGGGRELPLPKEEDAFTLFEGTALRLHNLSLERLETLRADPGLSPRAFRIRVARTQSSREQAAALVQRRYASRGYQLSGPRTEEPNLYTFVAYSSGDLVGTVGLRLDSSQGLAADQLYKAETEGMRSPGTRLCEFTRLAIDEAASSKPVLAGLFHTAYLFAHRVREFDTAVIEVNPRHVVFYKRALGFEVIGPERLNPRVNAPGVLLCVRLNWVADQLVRYAGHPELARSTHSLFPYGFSARDEEGILGRLRAFNAGQRNTVH